VVWAVAKSLVFRYYRWSAVPEVLFAGRRGALAKANLLGSAISAGVLVWVWLAGFPRSIPVIDFLLCAVAGSAATAGRVIGEAASAGRRTAQDGVDLRSRRGGRHVAEGNAGKPRVGIQLRVRGRRSRDAGSTCVGTGSWGRERNCEKCGETGAQEILIALPSAAARGWRGVLIGATRRGYGFGRFPPWRKLSRARPATEIRDVDVQDLLCAHPCAWNNRDPA